MSPTELVGRSEHQKVRPAHTVNLRRMDSTNKLQVVTELNPMEPMHTKRLYATHLNHGDKTALAYHTSRSEEYISKITRFGGDPCPTERDWKWLCDVYQVNQDCAIALLDALNANFADLRLHSAGAWNPTTTAAALVRKAADTVAALITDCQSDDEESLLALQRDVQRAIDECRSRKGVTKLKGVR